MWDDGDAYEIYREGEPMARKEHRCEECGRTIAKGERYLWATGLFDGRWNTHHMCAQCHQVTRWLGVVCDGWLHNTIEEDLLEHVTGHERELRSRPLTRLARWMRDDWTDTAGNLRSLDAVRALVDDALAAYERQLEAALA